MTGFDSKRDMAADKLQENLSATVFVYRHYKDKTIKAEYYSEAKLLDDSAEWEHIATLNPRMWIEYHYSEVEALADHTEDNLEMVAQPAQESLEDLRGALHRIDTVAVGLPTFEVRHEGGLDAFVQNIVDAIVALHEQRKPTTALRSKT